LLVMPLKGFGGCVEESLVSVYDKFGKQARQVVTKCIP
jgi:hypothetical protein